MQGLASWLFEISWRIASEPKKAEEEQTHRVIAVYGESSRLGLPILRYTSVLMDSRYWL